MKKIMLIMLLIALANPAFAADGTKKDVIDKAKVQTPKSMEKKAEPVVSTTTRDKLLNTPTEYDVVYGDLKAPIKIVEYASLSCSHCAHFNQAVKPDIAKKYIDAGKASLTLKPFPLNPPALRALLLANCTKDNNKRKAFIDALFASIESWAYPKNQASADAETKIKLMKIGKMGGINEKDADACINDAKKEKEIVELIKQAKEALKIESTPTFFINGVKFEGEKTFEDMSKAIDAVK
jgi:protein-disulfide isomerase